LNVADILNASPVSITGLGQSNNTFAGSTVGLQTTQLRGLGSSRTLVLVNGRRFVSGMSPSVGYAVDLNAIPTAMIERIDILKSASSAIYGSDAVAGVINIITRKEFEGLEVTAQTGTSSENDRDKFSISLTTGGSWNTGSATFSMGFDDDKGLNSSDRDFSRYDQVVVLDDAGQEEIGFLFSSFPPGGRVGGGTNAAGGPIGTYNGNGTAFDGTSSPTSGDRFNRAAFRQLSTPLERKYMAFSINQEINDNVAYFAEVNYNSSDTKGSTIEPTPFDIVSDVWLADRGSSSGMDINSPLIPELLRDNLIADGVTNLNQTNFVRRMAEFGPRATDVQRNTIRIAQGFDWNIDDNWALNTYMTWGRTSQNQNNDGQINIERAALALDVETGPDGELRCVSEDARFQGCVPMDLFHVGGVSQDAVSYVKIPAKRRTGVEQYMVSASMSGELPLELAGGNIATAFGVEHRLEKGFDNPGESAQVGATSGNATAPTDGSFTSDDVFVEFMFPVLDNFAINAAVRYSDHEIVDGQTTWNLGVEYSPIESLKLRASAATAIRTPNIADLFGGRGETFATVTDPCNGINVEGSALIDPNILANCMSIPSVASRVEQTGEFALTQTEIQGTGGTVGGNPDVKEETADTFSVGFVWQAMENLAFTVDYYDITVEDAISTTSRSTVLTRCFNQPTSTFTASCNGALLRDADGVLTDVNSGTSNENEIETSGIDFEVNYRMDLGPGVFTAGMLWTHTYEYVETEILDPTQIVDFRGEVLNPKDRANLNLGYEINDLNVSWRMRYWSKSLDSVEDNNANLTDFAALRRDGFGQFASFVYHDISATYHLTETVVGTLGVRNLFDKKPPFAGQISNSGSTGINTVPEAYDVTGRYFNASVTMKF
jgi:iron complex outermembrane receptor protein